MNKRISQMYRVVFSLALIWAFLLPSGGIADSTEFPAETFQRLTEYNPEQAYSPSKFWLKASSPELLGWSSEKLKVAKEYTLQRNTSAVVIIQNGIIVDEWGTPETPYKLHSIRKSLMNALYGIYVEASNIRLEDTLDELGIDDWNPPLTREEKQSRVSDLLQARSGVYHAAAYETDEMRAKRPERGSHAPGSYWYYNNWDFNALITIFKQQTGKELGQEFLTRIARPLRMEHFYLDDNRYLFELNKSQHPALLFRMSARDLARFGLLYLRNGKWGKQQIIPAAWIKLSTAPHSSIDSPVKRTRLFSHYGYLWWIGKDVYAALGRGGQALIIVPQYQVIIVHLAKVALPPSAPRRVKLTKLTELILLARRP